LKIDSKALCYSPRFSLEMRNIVGADSVRDPRNANSERDGKKKKLLNSVPLVVFTLVSDPFQLALKCQLFSSLQLQQDKM
jgi:hypothetical protein